MRLSYASGRGQPPLNLIENAFAYSVIPIGRDMFGFSLPPIPIPTTEPLIRGAVVFAEIAAGTGEANVGSLMPATLLERNDVVNGEAGVMMLAVGAKATLGEAHMGEFLGGKRAAITLDASAAAVRGKAHDVGAGSIIGTATFTKLIGIGSIIGAATFTDDFGVGNAIGTAVLTIGLRISGTVNPVVLISLFCVGCIIGTHVFTPCLTTGDLGATGPTLGLKTILFAFVSVERIKWLGEAAFCTVLNPTPGPSPLRREGCFTG